MGTKSVGHGVQLQVSEDSGTSYNSIASINLDGVTGVGGDGESVEVTTQDSPGDYREYLIGLLDTNEFAVGLVFDIDDDGTDKHSTLLDAFENKTLYKYQIIYPDGTKVIHFDAYVKGYSVDASSSDPITATITFRPTGVIDPDETVV